MSDEIILPFHNPLRDSAQRDAAHNDLGVARCPLCDAPMQMRVDRQGPRFVCLCDREEKVKAA
jgi:hypothetical protein